MASPQKQQQQQQQQQQLSPTQMSVRVGAIAGACALPFGATLGIVRGAPPVLFSLLTGAMWAVSAATFHRARWLALPNHGQPTPSEKVKASAIGGACSGAANALIFRPVGNVIPATVVVGTAGAVGQLLVNQWNKKASWSLATFLPMKNLTDREYEEMLEEKILRLEANIALVDERIAELKAQKKDGDE